MTFLELKDKLNDMTDDQLEQDIEVVLGQDNTMFIELAVGVSTGATFFVPEFNWEREGS